MVVPWSQACCVLFLICGGCAIHRANVGTARDAFTRGDLGTAQSTLEKIADSRHRSADAASMDLAIVELAAGDVHAAEQRLRKLRDRFDSFPPVAPIGTATSMVTDDNSRRFRPAAYEEVMILAMLAVCSLAGDAVDAESYAMQAAMKQEQLGRDAAERGLLEIETAYQPIAIAPYLRGMLREATHHDYDDAVRAYQLVSDLQPQFAPASADIQRAGGGAHSAAGHGVLYVIGCVGRGPILQEKEAETTSAALSIASSVLNAQTNKGGDGSVGGIVLPNMAQVKVPDVVIPQSDIEAIGVKVDGVLYGATQTLTDVGQLASRQVAAEMPWTIARAVARRATKEAIVVGTKKALDLDGAVGSLVHFAAATAWAATENADTRCWGLLPRQIQVLRAELPAGEHTIQLQGMNCFGGYLNPGVARTLSITNGYNTYLIVIAPDQVLYLAN